MEKDKAVQFPQLAITRFITAILIVIAHFGYAVYPFNSNKFLNTIVGFANASLSYFFVLSGFVLAVAYHDKYPLDLKRFYLSRFARVYPLYFVTVVYYVFFGKNGSFHPDFTFASLINAFLLQAWIPSFPFSMNFTTWFLSVIVFFYLLFPFIGNGIRIWGRNKSLLIVALIWMTSFFLSIALYKSLYTGFPSKSHDLIFFNPLMHLNAFIIGVWGGDFLKSYKDPVVNKSYIPALGLLLSSAAIILSLKLIISVDFIHAYGLPGILFNNNGLMAPLFLVLIISLSLDKTRISSFLSKNVFILLGHISYGVYLLQAPLRNALTVYFEKYNPSNPTLIFYLYLLLLTGVSLVLYFTYEKPMKTLIVSKYGK